jgi:DNA-binding transcriptional LysR family regulator
MDLAASQLQIDASTVGRRVARLEARLGARLFEIARTGRTLTEVGHRLVAHVERMEQAALRARAQVTSDDESYSGSVRLNVSEGFGTWVLPRHVPLFHRAHPKITVEIAASGGFLSPTKREADVAVMLARPTRGPLIVRKLADYHLSLYAAGDYVDQRGCPANVAALSGHSLVGYIPDLVHVPQQRILEEASGGLRGNVRSSSINAQAALIVAGTGIGVLPCFIGDQIKSLRPILSMEIVLTRTFWLVVHKNARPTAHVDECVRWLNAVVRDEHRLLAGTNFQLPSDS